MQSLLTKQWKLKHTFFAIFLHLFSQLHGKLVVCDTHCSHGPARMSVNVSTISSASCTWCYHFFSQRKQTQVSSIILLLLPIRIFKHPQYKCIYISNINQVEEQFQRPMTCSSHTSVFPHKLVQNVNSTFRGIIVHDVFRFVIFFLSHARVSMILWWKDNGSLVSCWYIWYQC